MKSTGLWDCAKILKLLLDLYLSNELKGEARHEVQNHFDHCPACAAELEARARIRKAMRDAVLLHETTPLPLQTRIRKRLRA
jgi:anti-sigma factor (TIGR02949 family)